MAFTGQQAVNLAESYLDDESIEDSDAILWINTFVTKIGSNNRKFSDTTITVTDSTTWHALPVTFLTLRDIEGSDGNRYQGKYRIRDGYFKAWTNDVFSLHYIRTSTAITALTDNVDVHDFLLPALGSFLASKFKYKDDDENPDGKRLNNEFQENMRDAINNIDGMNKSTHQIGVLRI